ncbi:MULTISPECIES: HNH endonuclease [unclassified Pantoea]|uniref:HNH endonuclease n=1 Tax=unclassified Pantoea TaxID=2630326 RepID=UPI001CD3E3C7|nr:MULTISPECIES: HNH endonuclease [unclassified Pantoea]MCA1179739.1 HNH endonuclease [Pantoea sp. alder69]MCA1252334.1 HNH endonuclease [Pantoea sp. alder70]MCA1268082.1 HNH endonuclease [Pantoea sp. alder81]
MIKIDRNFTPLFFTPDNVATLTSAFKENDAHVWQHKDVKEACLSIGNKKCAYCEVVLNQKSTYLEIDHFRDKKDYPDEVIQWENLLPACRHCNGTKSDHDVVDEPIINPAVDNPADHVYIKAYRLKGRDTLGEMTVEVLNLNDSEHFVIERCKVGSFIEEKIEEAGIKLQNYLSSPNSARKRELNKIIKALLKQCQKNALFSAVSATSLHESEEYAGIRAEMIRQSIWITDYECQHQDSLTLRLPVSK